MLSISVSVLRAACGGGAGARAASAAGSTVSASPSKKRVIAIWAFHWHRCSKGTAASSSWSVTEVYCWRASCCSSLREVRSKAGLDMVACGVDKRPTVGPRSSTGYRAMSERKCCLSQDLEDAATIGKLSALPAPSELSGSDPFTCTPFADHHTSRLRLCCTFSLPSPSLGLPLPSRAWERQRARHAALTTSGWRLM